MHTAEDIADELRSVIDALTSSTPDDATLAALHGHAAAMRSVTDGLERSRYWERGEGGAGFQTVSPFRGTANPVAPPVTIEHRLADDPPTVLGHVTVPATYEGPPGAVHGGIVAGLFDEVLGAAQAVLGQGTGGVTGILRVRYRHRTPLGAPLLIRSWLERDTGRRTMARAECFAGDVRTAEAEALFVRSAPTTQNRAS